MKYLLVILLGAVVVMQASAQQIPQLSFRHQNVLLNNPAAAGPTPCATIAILHREQWIGFENAPSTSYIAYQQNFLQKNGIGISLMSDRTFPTSRFIINASYAYIIKMERINLSLGLAALMMQYNFKNSDLSYRDPLDPSLEFSATQKWRPESNAGLMIYNEQFYVSLSVNQLLNSAFKPFSNDGRGLVQNSRHFCFAAQYHFVFDAHNISPGFYLAAVKSSPFTAEFSAQYKYKNAFSVSMGYRWADAVNTTIGYRYDRFYLGYSFDLITSYFRNTALTSHEVMLTVDIGCNTSAAPRF